MWFQPFDSLLIANRGEIVARIARTARRMGLRTIAVYSDADRDAPYLQHCDQVLALGGHSPSESYLSMEKILNAAEQSGAQAIHPGYGFLSENADFAQAVLDAGMVWVGPSPASMQAMADKAHARCRMQQVGIPVLPGTDALHDLDALQMQAQVLGLPLMVKAAAGGGGRGMRLVTDWAALAQALVSAQSEAQAAFGDGRLLLERALMRSSHVEVQVLADAQGHVLHLGERDCSVQRRHQKLIEEAPSPRVNAALRRRMGAVAVAVARAASDEGYCGVGTVEFLLDEAGDFWFMEMNTRLQVEHPVTECLTGLDLVEWQLRIAQGEACTLQQNDLLERYESAGHAMEVRLCAEDPLQAHLPQAGVLHWWQAPEPLRVDAALQSGQPISAWYDSMLGKLIAHGRHRDDARRQLIQGLSATICMGLHSNRHFLAKVLAHEHFASGQVHTDFLSLHDKAWEPTGDQTLKALAVVALLMTPLQIRAKSWQLWRSAQRLERTVVLQAGHERQTWHVVCTHGSNWQVRLQDQTTAACAWDFSDVQLQQVPLDVGGETPCHAAIRARLQAKVQGRSLEAHWLRVGSRFWIQSGLESDEGEDQSLEAAPDGSSQSDLQSVNSVCAPMHGRVVRVEVTLGDEVQVGDVLLVLEAMKMEHRLTATRSGRVSWVHASVGQQVAMRQVLVEIENPR